MAASLDLSVAFANRPDLFAGPVTVAAERSSSARRGQSRPQCSCPGQYLQSCGGGPSKNFSRLDLESSFLFLLVFTLGFVMAALVMAARLA
eukprot:1124340-Pyramimonas_sp.AAC.1